MGLVCEVFETIVTSTFTIAGGDDAACFGHYFDPPLVRVVDESGAAGRGMALGMIPYTNYRPLLE
jgi:hypothetical protein